MECWERGLSRPSVFGFFCFLLLTVCCFLWRILQPFKHTLFILLLTVLAIDFFPFSYLFPIICISTVGIVINTIKHLHIFITISFYNTRQADFQNFDLLILAVNPAFQFPFLCEFWKSFQVVDYSCAMKSRFRKSGNQITGRRKSSLASLLA